MADNGPTQVEILLDIAQHLFTLGVDQYKRPFAVIKGSPGVGYLIEENAESLTDLLRLMFAKNEKPLSSSGPLKAALEHLASQARQLEPTMAYVRTAAPRDNGDRYPSQVWIDLGDDETEGFAVVKDDGTTERTSDAPEDFIFLRTASVAPYQVNLSADGSKVFTDAGYILQASRLVNPGEEFKERWPLIVAWMTAALIDGIQVPALALVGTAGSAKTETQRRIAALVDPSIHEVMPMPEEARDLAAVRSHNFLLSFDNLGRQVSPGMSDAFARLITGAADQSRMLYTNAAVSVTPRTRNPVTLSMVEVAEGWKTDARERILFVPTERVRANKPETEVVANFESILPGLRASLLQGLAEVLQNLPSVEVADKSSRFADFVRVLEAFDVAHDTNTVELFAQSVAGSEAEIVRASPVAYRLFAMMTKRDVWVGTMKDLLADLMKVALPLSEGMDFPQYSADKTGSELRHLINSLDRVGLRVDVRSTPWRLPVELREEVKAAGDERNRNLKAKSRWLVITKGESYDEHAHDIIEASR